jgi:hypothetical protein
MELHEQASTARRAGARGVPRHTSKKPDTRTSFDYHVELKLPTAGESQWAHRQCRSAPARRSAVFVTGRKGIAVVLDVGGNVVAILRGTVTRTRLELPVPPREVAPGVRAALVKFKLKIGGGSAKKPVLKTPATCPKGGGRPAWKSAHRADLVSPHDSKSALWAATGRAKPDCE